MGDHGRGFGVETFQRVKVGGRLLWQIEDLIPPIDSRSGAESLMVSRRDSRGYVPRLVQSISGRDC